MSDMLQPRTVHVDQHLSNVAIAFRPVGFVADQLCPIVPVPHQSDTYLVWTQADQYRLENTRRSPSTEARRVTWQVGSASYLAQNYALKAGMQIETRENMDPIFVREREEGITRRLTELMMLDYETRVASLWQNSSNVGSFSNVVSSWTSSGATPVDNIFTAMENVADATGYVPNRIHFGIAAWRTFQRHQQVRNSVMNPNVSAGGPLPMQEAVARFFGVDKITVGRAYRTTGQQGQPLSLTPVWGNHVTAYYAPANPSIVEPSFSYAFRWVAPGLQQMNVRRLPYDEKIQAQDFEVGYYQDEVITAARLAFTWYHVSCSQAA